MSGNIQTTSLRCPDFPNLALNMLHIGATHIRQAKLFNEFGYMDNLSLDIYRKSIELSFGSSVEKFYTLAAHVYDIAIVL